MKRIIHVCLGDDARLVGELRYDQQGSRESVAFAYAPEWLASVDRFQLDPTLPLVAGFQYHSPAEPEPKVHHRLGRAVRCCCGGFRPHTPVTRRHEIFGQQEDFAP